MSGEGSKAGQGTEPPVGGRYRSGGTAVPAMSSPLAPGDVVQGQHRFRLDAALGQGASGSVFRATCLDSDGTPATPPVSVAVKVVSLPRDDVRALAMRQELSSLRAIRSRHIPAVYDWALDGPRGFVVMGLYEHGTLRDHLRKHGAYSEEQAWRLLSDLLGALRDAHNASVLHLDIKPANVLLDGQGGHVLADFGISQGAHARGGLRSIGAGTPGFRAPEQRLRQVDQFDMRTDLYSAGATVWAAYTGQNPASKGAVDLQNADPSQTHGLPPPTHYRQLTSPALEAMLMRLLYQDKARRPGSAPEVLALIDRVHDATLATRLPGRPVEEREALTVIDELLDPLWHHLFSLEPRGLRRVAAGETLCLEGERSYHAYIVLRGQVEVWVGGEVVTVEDREGTFLGEAATLTGGRRTATLRARGTVYLRVLNASQLEQLVTRNPSTGVRLMRAMAERMVRERGAADT
jgi:serine/threonine protein kinase